MGITQMKVRHEISDYVRSVLSVLVPNALLLEYLEKPPAHTTAPAASCNLPVVDHVHCKVSLMPLLTRAVWMPTTCLLLQNLCMRLCCPFYRLVSL